MNNHQSWNELSESERKLRVSIICTMIATASVVGAVAKTVYYFNPLAIGSLSHLIISDVIFVIMGISAIFFDSRYGKNK